MTWAERVKVVRGLVLTNLACSLVLSSLFPAQEASAGLAKVLNAYGWWALVVVGTWVLVEECGRLLPFLLAPGKLLANRWFVGLTSAATAAAFGLAHMKNGLPWWWALTVQGTGGLLLNHCFVRTGGTTGHKVSGLMSSWGMHAAYDGALIALALLTVGR